MIRLNEQNLVLISIIVIIAIASFMFFVRSKVEDIEFCRIVLSRLVKGNFAVQKFIDWEDLKTKGLVGFDVGQTYSALASKQEQELYRKTFIKGFSLGFSKGKGDIINFTNWRVISKSPEQAVIAVDYKGKTILFTISRSRDRKLTGIQWQ
jgi:hypothetical protein